MRQGPRVGDVIDRYDLKASAVQCQPGERAPNPAEAVDPNPCGHLVPLSCRYRQVRPSA
jgi:hypothetical protein